MVSKKAIKQTRNLGIRDQNCKANRVGGDRQVAFLLRFSVSWVKQRWCENEWISLGALRPTEERAEQCRGRFLCCSYSSFWKSGTFLIFYQSPKAPHLTAGKKHWLSRPSIYRHFSRPYLSFSEHKYCVIVTFSVGLSSPWFQSSLTITF